MKVVVTGGAGFIGANLCRELLRRPGVEVVVLDNLSTGRLANLSDLPVDLRIGSVLDYGAVSAACAGAHSIVHLAVAPSSTGQPGSRDADSFGTAMVVEVAREIGAHLVLGSHTAARQAVAGEQCCVFRISHVFGPLQNPDHPWAIISAFIEDALHDRPLTIYGDGEQIQDFTFVTSAAEVLAEAVIGRIVQPSPVDLAFGEPTTINEVVTILSELLGHRLRVQHVPPRAGQDGHYLPGPSVLPELFGKVRPVPLAHGLLRTLSWLERQILARPDKNEVSA